MEEACLANAVATRALVNDVDGLYRSPRHGHALSRSVVLGRSCVSCRKVIFSGGASCKLCGVCVHRDCSAYAPACSANNVFEKKETSLSLAAMRYLSLRKAGETRFGKAVTAAVEKRRGFFGAESDADALRAYASRAVVSSAEMTKMEAAAQGKEEEMYLKARDKKKKKKKKKTSKTNNLATWAGATAAGTLAGGVVGGAVAGPAGAFLGAKIAQSSTNVGALVVGAAVGYRQRYLLSDVVEEEDEFDRRDKAERAANRATFGRSGRGDDEPWAAAAAAAVAKAHLEKIPLEFRDEDFPELAAKLQDDTKLLDDSIPPFVDAILSENSCPSRVRAALENAYFDTITETIDAEAAADRAVRWSRRLCVEVVAFFPALAKSARLLDAAERAVDKVVFAKAYDDLFPRFIDVNADATLEAACDDTHQQLAGTFKNRARFNAARTALLSLEDTKPPLDKLHTITFALRELANAAMTSSSSSSRRQRTGDNELDDDSLAVVPEDVSADVLLPQAVDCVRAARLPHFHAHLAFVEALCHTRDFLGAQGYALTTLRCAIAVLCRNLDKVEEQQEASDDDEGQ